MVILLKDASREIYSISLSEKYGSGFSALILKTYLFMGNKDGYWHFSILVTDLQLKVTSWSKSQKSLNIKAYINGLQETNKKTFLPISKQAE